MWDKGSTKVDGNRIGVHDWPGDNLIDVSIGLFMAGLVY